MIVALRDEFFHENINLRLDDVRHDYHVSDVRFACELPSLYKSFVHWSLHDDCAGQIVKSAHDVSFLELVSEVNGGVHAVLHFTLDALHTLHAKCVPHVQCSVAIARSHNCGVDRVEVFDVLLHFPDMRGVCECYAAGHRTSQHLVS